MQKPTIGDFQLATNNLVKSTIQQVKKDWERAGIRELDLSDDLSPEKFVDTFKLALNELIDKQPETLMNLLYLIDLNEEKLQWQSGDFTIEKMAEVIVLREFFKVKLRSIL